MDKILLFIDKRKAIINYFELIKDLELVLPIPTCGLSRQFSIKVTRWLARTGSSSK